jgi:hypothetical protein
VIVGIRADKYCRKIEGNLRGANGSFVGENFLHENEAQRPDHAATLIPKGMSVLKYGPIL